MNILEVRLDVANEPRLTEHIKQVILTHFRAIGPTKVQRVWNNAVPRRHVLTIDVGGAAVSLMDDWQCTIFSRTHRECMSILFVVHSTLQTALDLQITPDILEPSEGLERLINQQRRRDFIVQVPWLLVGALAGALAGAGITVLIK